MRNDTKESILRLIPTRTATLYLIFFVLSLGVSITMMNISEDVFRTFTSCNGDAEYEISIFMALVFLQSILVLVKVEHELPNRDEELEESMRLAYQLVDKEGNLLPSKQIKSSREDMMRKRNLSKETSLDIICDVFTDDSSRDVTSQRSGRLHRTNTSSEDASETQYSYLTTTNNSSRSMRETGDYIIKQRSHYSRDGGRRSSLHSWSQFSVCWNSLWMLFYHLVIFMSIHATLLASRINGTIELNKYAMATCSHIQGKFPLGMFSPRMTHPLLSEYTFFLTYLSCTSCELITRKYADASYLRNFISRDHFKICKLFACFRILVQIGIFAYSMVMIGMSIYYGFGSPMQIVSGFSVGMLVLFVIAALTQLLQLSHMSTSTLEWNWFWSILSLMTFWISGFMFYISVYGIPLTVPYTYLQIGCWLPLTILTMRKGKAIFNWRDISSALYTFN
ncbi:hypothetical protein BgAZ_501900 [Babesia gibsoni]|uniref:Uncharacterized protein n=1 Tax=Babesia gibsoni TaxID=33632 RepID=A0AAD8PCA8_BABGI|nr:hypothetical protein BgAZ_501900 [Babesia gibsoni]